MFKKWEELPRYMKTEEVRPYYEKLSRKRKSLAMKRGFDLAVAVAMLAVLLPAGIMIAILVAADSGGGIFFCQERVTQYGRKFRIIKFRTMTAEAGQGAQVTKSNDRRITRVGRVLRKYRLDELPQLLNIIAGDMSFVGARPEVPYYVDRYTPEMCATLLLPAGVTSEASICYKDEGRLLDSAANVDEVYVHQILPGKMEYNLKGIRKFSVIREFGIMVRTVRAVFTG